MNADVGQLIKQAMKNGGGSLSEHASKKLVGACSVPVVDETLAKTADEAADAAKRLGLPVALKACAPQLLHKKDQNLVALGLADENAVRLAYGELVEHTGSQKIEGILVQPMISGERELLLGMNRAPGFGPCVTLGMGGIFAEAVRDVAVRVAPVSRADALDMMDELRGAPILGEIRGLAAADRDALAAAIMGLSDLALQHPEISEIDVNPIIIGADGSPLAVDALVILGEPGGGA